MNFSGRHVVVTGASTGIGRAAALMLGARGAKVSLIARSGDKLDALADEIAARGGTAKGFTADVSDRAALSDVFDAAAEAFGPASGLFANAGFGGQFAPFTDYSDDNWDALIATNLTSVFLSIRKVLPGMIAARQGSIVVTGSLASERGMPMNAGYVASKHGVLGLARAAAAEAAPHNVRVNCLIPGFIETPLLHNIGGDDIEGTMQQLGKGVPQGRVGQPEETAELVSFLLSDAASHITAQSIAVDGGLLGTLIP
ncbi:SDR family NAD(P)-dependent oxidoreductase [Parerythrobacter aestuarii]|uniref:SDR family NAD(P)-dependent oxidoreductase n=1 Tax=Parerythrobacter aestuarii TaxID=3020909 RepID=UPI0024DE0526|nr:SDR family NAD(P)-dependent oxidoreductase [Parerythrobacter aestuarii]